MRHAISPRLAIRILLNAVTTHGRRRNERNKLSCGAHPSIDLHNPGGLALLDEGSGAFAALGTAQRGSKGFGRIVEQFRHRGRTYFADWKSDLLDSYGQAAVAAHVADRYLVQAQIYTIGIVRLLRIRDRREYEERFGGLVYVFLRGVEPRGEGRNGVYFHRPSWNEIVEYEQTLMSPA